MRRVQRRRLRSLDDLEIWMICILPFCETYRQGAVLLAKGGHRKY